MSSSAWSGGDVELHCVLTGIGDNQGIVPRAVALGVGSALQPLIPDRGKRAGCRRLGNMRENWIITPRLCCYKQGGTIALQSSRLFLLPTFNKMKQNAGMRIGARTSFRSSKTPYSILVNVSHPYLNNTAVIPVNHWFMSLPCCSAFSCSAVQFF
jgi:hypothetical protein